MKETPKGFEWKTATPHERDVWIAIHACGWKWYRLASVSEVTVVRNQLLTPAQLRDWLVAPWRADEVDEPAEGEFSDASSVPQYTSYLPAAFEMEEELKARGLADDYGIALSLVICGGGGKIVEASLFDLAHASPEQRAHAAYLTLNDEANATP